MAIDPANGCNQQSRIGRDQNMKNVGPQLRGQFAQEVGQSANEATGIATMYFRYGRQEDAKVGYTPPEDNAQAAPAQSPPATPPKLSELGLPPGPAGNTVNVVNNEGIG